MSSYTTTIGLEIHAELKTKTKMFCNSKNDPDEKRPNVNICPVCLAHPGTLPVINKEAVKHVLTMGVAVGGVLSDFTEFDRKNYFYPDIPKGYQISQYKYPLVLGGTLLGVAITRIHLEEDTARSTHDDGDKSLVDFNRAGVPLMELVTEPVIRDATIAVAFAKELQLLLRTLGAGEANMEKGEMRVEANISVSKGTTFGTKVEVKNLNSFKAVERAIAYEIHRQVELLDAGEKVVQETRGWDDVAQATFSQRLKEESQDYRYFPDPDLPKLRLSTLPEFSLDALKSKIPELPDAKRKRFAEWGIKKEDAEIYVSNQEYSKYIDEVAKELVFDTKKIQLASNYFTSDLVGIYKTISTEEVIALKPKDFAHLIVLLSDGKISSRGAKDILKHIGLTGGDPLSVAKEHSLLQESNESTLIPLIDTIIANNQSVVEEYKKGKIAALQFLVGQVMKETKGSANPQLLQKLVSERLG